MIAPFSRAEKGATCAAVRNFSTHGKESFSCMHYCGYALRAPTCLHPSVVCTRQLVLAKQIEVR